MAQLAVTLVTVGAVLLFVGVIGEAFGLLGAKMPKVGIAPRVLAFLLCFPFFIGAFVVWSSEKNGPKASPSPTTTTERQPTPTDSAPITTPSTTPITPTDTSPPKPVPSAASYEVTGRIDQDDVNKGALELGVEVRIDDELVGLLVMDPDNRRASVNGEVSTPGSHRYDLSLTFNEQPAGQGSGTVDIQNGAHFEVAAAGGRLILKPV